MAALTASIEFDRVYSTTLAVQRDDVAMEIVQSNPLLWHMYRQGAVQYDGGTEVRQPVVLEETANISAIGAYETFGTAPDSGPDTARYPTWYKNRASIVLDNTELAQNRGASQIVSLLNAKLAIAKISMINDLARQLYADNTGSTKEINGLQTGFLEFATEAVQATTGATVGGIDKQLYANWRNRYGQMTAFGTDGLGTWETIYMDASQRGTHPDIILTDPAVYRFFKRTVASNQAERDNNMWDQGFHNILFEGTPVVPDYELDGTGQTYFLTTSGKRAVQDFNLKPEYFTTPGKNPLAKGKHTGIGLGLAILSQDDFRMTDFMTPPNADTILAHCYLSCMLVSASNGRQGCSDFSGTVQF